LRRKKKVVGDTVPAKTSKRSVAKTPTYDGITFDSNLELYCYKALQEAKLDFKYTPTTYTLVPGFTFNGKSYEADKRVGKYLVLRTSTMQSIKYTPDFVGDGWIIETKGAATDVFTMRYKLFKKYLTESNIVCDLYMPKNHLQVNQVIELILKQNDDNS
jgi:hypothetical protein